MHEMVRNGTRPHNLFSPRSPVVLLYWKDENNITFKMLGGAAGNPLNKQSSAMISQRIDNQPTVSIVLIDNFVSVSLFSLRPFFSLNTKHFPCEILTYTDMLQLWATYKYKWPAWQSGQ